MPLALTKSDRDIQRLHLNGGQLLLLHQALAEAAYGIRVPHFAAQVGMPRTRVRAVLNDFEALMKGRPLDADELPIGDFQLELSAADIRALRNALELVMRDFGHEEFSTRTGFALSDGARMFHQLNAALIAPLHIEHRQQSVAHEQAATSR